MTKPYRVVTVVGTRPEIIRLSRLVPALDNVAENLLVHTGQNSDPLLSDVFFGDLGLRTPDVFLDADSTSVASLMGDVLKGAERLVGEHRPHAAMILGDTNSAMAAIIFERLGVPVYHMEAGNRSFDNNVPEELNRRIVDHASTFNLPYNDYSLRNLLSEGKHPRFLCKTGSPIPEVISNSKDAILSSSIMESLGVESGKFLVASLHRQENVDFPDRLSACIEALEHASSYYGVPVFLSTHPRTRARLEKLRLTPNKNVIFHEPFGYLDYNKLQSEALCVISDSGTISEESAILGFAAVTLRESMERPESLASGHMLISGINKHSLISTIQMAIHRRHALPLPEGYDQAEFSTIVTNFFLSTVHLSKTWKGLI